MWRFQEPNPHDFTRHKLVPLQVTPAMTYKRDTTPCHASKHPFLSLLLLHALPSASTFSFQANGHTWNDQLCRETCCRALTPCREHLPAKPAASSSGYDKIHVSGRWSHRKDNFYCTEASWGFRSQEASSWWTSGNTRENTPGVIQLRRALRFPGRHRTLQGPARGRGNTEGWDGTTKGGLKRDAAASCCSMLKRATAL